MLDNSIPVTAYGELPDGEMKEQAEKMCKGKTIEQLRQLGSYFSEKAHKMSRTLEHEVTMEDFEKVKKSTEQDDDGY